MSRPCREPKPNFTKRNFEHLLLVCKQAIEELESGQYPNGVSTPLLRQMYIAVEKAEGEYE